MPSGSEFKLQIPVRPKKVGKRQHAWQPKFSAHMPLGTPKGCCVRAMLVSGYYPAITQLD